MSDKKEFFINTTNNYSMFKFLNTNREPNKAILKKLEKSILEHGVQIPIIVNQDKEIVDGQHRFWTLRKLKYNVPYVVTTAWEDDSTTIEINMTSTKWSAKDFAEYACKKGNLDVCRAIDIQKKFYAKSKKRLGLITVLEIFMEGRTHSGLRARLKNLDYRIDEIRGFQVLDTIFEIDNHEIQGNPFSARMARAIKVMNYDYDDLNEQVIAIMCQDNYVRIYNSEADQLEYLQDIYNKALAKYNRLKK